VAIADYSRCKTTSILTSQCENVDELATSVLSVLKLCRFYEARLSHRNSVRPSHRWISQKRCKL